MIQLGQRPRFAGKTLGESRVATAFRRQDLERDKAVKRLLPRLVHGPHAAIANQRDQIELREVRGQFVGPRGSEALGLGWAGCDGSTLSPQAHFHKAFRTQTLNGSFAQWLATTLTDFGCIHNCLYTVPREKRRKVPVNYQIRSLER